jgi:TolB-like protein/Tfp pilus assembly protein PilF
VNEPPALASPAAETPADPPPASVAVLPFVDMSETGDQEYLSDGLSEELINLLARSSDLRVPARTSSFYFKDKPTTVAEIAKVLNVAHVLEGSVRRSCNTVRVTAQLIRVDSGYHLWSQTFDRDVTDILRLQDEIAGTVAQALKTTLLPGTAQTRPTAEDETAYDLLLQARYHWGRRTPEDLLKAGKLYRRVLAVNPSSAHAWAGLSQVYAEQAAAGNPDDLFTEKAREAALEAIRLDPNLAEGHRALGWIHGVWDINPPAALEEYRKALALDPLDTQTNAQASYVTGLLGRWSEAQHLAEVTVDRDPLYPGGHRVHGVPLYRLGQYDKALAELERAIELAPSRPGLRWLLARTQLADSDPQRALQTATAEPDPAARAWALGLAYAALGDVAASDAQVAQLEAIPRNRGACGIAEVHALRGRSADAETWIRRCASAGDLALLSWLDDPLLTRLPEAPRYRALVLELRQVPGRNDK